MIGADADTGFELGERQRDERAFRREAERLAVTGERLSRKRGYLTSEEVADRLQERQEAVGELSVEAVETVPPAAKPMSDPEVPLRYARIGFTAVVVGVLFLLWLKQRRRAG